MKLKLLAVCLLAGAAFMEFGASASAEAVRLHLVATGGDEITGGLAAQHIVFTTNAPAGIKQAPAGLVAPLYGVITLGPRENPGTYYVIVDEPAEQPARLFVNASGTGDFGADQPLKWPAEAAGKGSDGREFFNHEGTATVKVAYGADQATLGLQLYRLDKNDPRRAEVKDFLFYYADYVRTGQVTLGPKTFAAMLVDAKTTGDFRPEPGTNKPSTTLFLDLNGDGKFARRAEAFFPGKPFNIGGTTYELANFSASGDRFEVVTSAQTVPETLPLPILTAGHPALPFAATNTAGKPVNFPADYTGKVVLLDFWATWCGPCVAELPNVVAAYDQYHTRGFEILGVSFDRANAAAKLASFTEDHHAPWPQIYEGKFWQTTIGTQYNIDSIPHAFLVDGTTGKIVAEGEDIRGDKLAPAIRQALGRR